MIYYIDDKKFNLTEIELNLQWSSHDRWAPCNIHSLCLARYVVWINCWVFMFISLILCSKTCPRVGIKFFSVPGTRTFYARHKITITPWCDHPLESLHWNTISAQFVEEQAPGVFPKTLRNMWLGIMIFNPLLSLISFSALSLDEVMEHHDTVLARTKFDRRFYSIGSRTPDRIYRNQWLDSTHGHGSMFATGFLVA